MTERFYARRQDLWECFTNTQRLQAFTRGPAVVRPGCDGLSQPRRSVRDFLLLLKLPEQCIVGHTCSGGDHVWGASLSSMCPLSFES